MPVDKPRIEAAVREILLAVGEDPDRDGLVHTPARVARAYEEFFAGLEQDPADVLSAVFELGHEEMILVKDIELYSLCEHHLVPFHGVAHVGYIPGPDGRITGKRLTKSSGVKSWDDAVLRAIDKTESLPRDENGRIYTPLTLVFTPHN